MKTDEYLRKVLDQQTFENDDQELIDLRARRTEIERSLRVHFWMSSPSIKWAGSMAKGTMIRESYDGDMTVYFPEDETEAGSSLEEIYQAVEEVLQAYYGVERKASALRVRNLDDSGDLHIDVVPGRYVDDTKSDVYLHRTTGDKARLKTNLQTHIDHIKNSGVIDAIRLCKLWKALNGLEAAKTFVLELLVVKLLDGKQAWSLSTQLEHVWTDMRDHAASLAVDDPANTNNDLKSILDECRYLLESAAANTLASVARDGWQVIFGELEEQKNADRSPRASSLGAAVAAVRTPTRPWGDA